MILLPPSTNCSQTLDVSVITRALCLHLAAGCLGLCLSPKSGLSEDRHLFPRTYHGAGSWELLKNAHQG